jgi:hypothetical protein
MRAKPPGTLSAWIAVSGTAMTTGGMNKGEKFALNPMSGEKSRLDRPKPLPNPICVYPCSSAAKPSYFPLGMGFIARFSFRPSPSGKGGHIGDNRPLADCARGPPRQRNRRSSAVQTNFHRWTWGPLFRSSFLRVLRAAACENPLCVACVSGPFAARLRKSERPG